MMYDHFFDKDHILENEKVRLEPLKDKHFELLQPVALNKILWEFTTAKINTYADFKKYFDMAMEEKRLQKSYPFAVYDKQQNQYAGCTRFGNIEFKHKKVEIGWTWIHPQLHGTGFNKQCKFLLLSFCFETLLLNRVELKTSSLNLRSQKAMLKIGAVKEGILRRNIINDDGSTRDSVYFSFIKEEWPVIKERIFAPLLSP